VRRKYHKSGKLNDFQRSKLKSALIAKEIKLIKDNFDFIECNKKGEKLICNGKHKPTSNSQEYFFKIEYDVFNPPKVFIEKPKIEYNDNIHMFPSDNSLCLYHKTDLIKEKWSFKNYNLFDTIIPWTIEWLVFYELYSITGKWEHPFVPHNLNK
jgi:hypothetical protein